MKMVLALGLAGLLLLGAPAAAEDHRVHGSDAIFSDASLAIAWAVLKDSDDARVQIVTRIVSRGGYRFVSLDGVDPMTRVRQRLVAAEPLVERLDLRSPRQSFAELPSREFHFYRTEAERDAEAPALTVYYLGVPDTTPEFTTESALLAYLGKAVP